MKSRWEEINFECSKLDGKHPKEKWKNTLSGGRSVQLARRLPVIRYADRGEVEKEIQDLIW